MITSPHDESNQPTMPSRWTPYQFEQIRRAFPEFKTLGPKPSLNSIVVTFLEKYEVYVTPATTSDRRTGGEAASDAFFGAMSGATGNHEYAADAAIIEIRKRVLRSRNGRNGSNGR